MTKNPNFFVVVDTSFYVAVVVHQFGFLFFCLVGLNHARDMKEYSKFFCKTFFLTDIELIGGQYKAVLCVCVCVKVNRPTVSGCCLIRALSIGRREKKEKAEAD